MQINSSTIWDRTFGASTSKYENIFRSLLSPDFGPTYCLAGAEAGCIGGRWGCCTGVTGAMGLPSNWADMDMALLLSFLLSSSSATSSKDRLVPCWGGARPPPRPMNGLLWKFGWGNWGRWSPSAECLLLWCAGGWKGC